MNKLEQKNSQNCEITVDEILKHHVNIGRDQKTLSKGLEDRILFRKNGIIFLDPLIIKQDLEAACAQAYNYAVEGKKLLFIDVTPVTSELFQESAENAGEYHCTQQWRPGSVTNISTVYKLSLKIQETKKILEDSKLLKKDLIAKQKQIEKSERVLGGISQIKGRPDLVITIANKENFLCLKECRISGVNTIEFCDTDRYDKLDAGNSVRVICNTSGRDSVAFLLKHISKSVLQGRRDRVKGFTGTDFSKILERKKSLNEKK